jgi:hypothetical protein
MRRDERLGSAMLGSVRLDSARLSTETAPLRLLLRNRGSVFRCGVNTPQYIDKDLYVHFNWM